MTSDQFRKTFLLVMLGATTRGAADDLVPTDPALFLISARDQIPGSFLQDQAVFADGDRIYLASYEGTLFVLARDRFADFPLIQTVVLKTRLTAVRGDQKNIYVSTGDGQLMIFSKTFPLRQVKTISLSDFGLNSLAVLENQVYVSKGQVELMSDGQLRVTRKTFPWRLGETVRGDEIYVSKGQAEMEVDQRRVYLSTLNEGDIGLRLRKDNLLIDLIYGQTFSPWVTEVYDRRTAAAIGRIANPIGSQVALFGDQTRLYQTVPGCCGLGIFVYNKDTLTLDQFIPRAATNTVAAANQLETDLLIGGTEWGSVDLFDLSRIEIYAPLLSSVDLRTATGHTGPEDIEIRALWADGLDDLVFAASSWGNDSSRSPDLPSFFVLQIRLGN